MARRPSLTDACISRPSQALPPPALVENSKRSPAQRGEKRVAFRVEPGASTQLRVTAVTMGRSV